MLGSMAWHFAMGGGDGDGRTLGERWDDDSLRQRKQQQQQRQEQSRGRPTDGAVYDELNDFNARLREQQQHQQQRNAGGGTAAYDEARQQKQRQQQQRRLYYSQHAAAIERPRATAAATRATWSTSTA